MLAVVSEISALDQCDGAMQSLGYEVLGEFGMPGRRYFRRDNPAGERTHQIHAFEKGPADVCRHLAFRDFMRAHPVEAEQYAALKRALAERFPADIEGYMDGKDSFIKAMEARAVAWVEAGCLD